jgi:LPXTG-motif cell wall-anchored protein
MLLVLAVIAGGFTVLIGASPASAHFSSVKGDAKCDSDTGNWVITWTVESHATDLSGQLVRFSSTPAEDPVSGIDVGSIVPATPGALVGTQIVPNGTASSASITERTQWTDGFVDYFFQTAKVDLGNTCVAGQPKPNASFSSACDGTVTVTLTNDADATKAAAFTVLAANNFTKSVTLDKGGSSQVVVPAVDANSITVNVGGVKIATGSFKDPGNCPPVQVSSKMDCTTLTITLDNPANNRPVDATLTDGTNTQTVTIDAGGTKTVTFPGKTGETVTISFVTEASFVETADAAQPVTVVWTVPAACLVTPTTPTLPTTGAHLTPLIASGAALLLAGAAVLYILFRRRLAADSRSL